MFDLSKKLKLSNGLSVIYEHNTHAPVVSLNIGVKVGSVHEQDDESGICHLIEHMVFKGTDSFQPGEIATLVEAHGGELNAYTSLDQTVYYINLPKENLALGLKILKEMVFDAHFDALELEREKEVVVEEIRRGQDNPQRVLSELLFSTHFKKHNYRRPVIGTEAHVRGFSRDKIYKFYKKHYCPQNMTLGICGDVKESEVSALLEKLFRFEEGAPLQQVAVPKEPAPTRLKVAQKSMDVQSCYLDLAFAAPALHHEDVPALDTMSHLLGEGGASLLEQITKEKLQLVNYIYSGCYTPRYPGLFVVGCQLQGKNVNATLASIIEQIETMKTKPVAIEELERAKLLAKAQLVYDKQTCEGTARKWMSYETTVGDYKFDEVYTEAVSHLNPDDIQRVAQKYLDLTKASLVILHPKKEKIQVDRSLFRKAKPKAKAYKKRTQKKDVTFYELDNGLRVGLKENPRLDLFSLKILSLGGLRYETATNNGWSLLMSNLMTKGAGGLSQKDIAERCESMAAHLSAYAGRNSWGVSLTALSSKRSDALALTGDVLLRPEFAADEVKKEKHLQMQALQNREDNLAQLAFHHTLKSLFGKHPYGRSVLGEKKSIQAATGEKLGRFHKQFLSSKNLVMCAVGDFKKQEFLDELNSTFGQIPKKAFAKKTHTAPKPPKKSQLIVIDKARSQAHLVVGFLGASLKHKDRHALEVLNHVFSGQGGRLFLELRDKQSLAYSVSSTIVEGLETGFFGIYMGTEPSKLQVAYDGILKEIEKVQNKAIGKVELDRAKNYIIGNFAIDHQRNGDIAMQLGLNELYGKGIDEYFDHARNVKKVTAADVQRVARQYLRLDRAIISVVGPKGFLKI